jgi:putative flavoprotein involved in K+ transport
MNTSQTVETVIVGGGAAGLAVGYHLTRRDRPFVVLDGHQRIGDSWRTRWDSLRLFTPAKYSGLPGWPIPASGNSFPTKDEVADHLQAYADRFEMPTRTGVRVTGLSRRDGRYVVEYGDRRLEADHVVVATGTNRAPRVPEFAEDLNREIVQLHSSDYRNPAQLRDGAVLWSEPATPARRSRSRSRALTVRGCRAAPVARSRSSMARPWHASSSPSCASSATTC